MGKGGGTAGGSRGGAPIGGGVERSGGAPPREAAPKAPKGETGIKHTKHEIASTPLHRQTDAPTYAHRMALGKDTRHVNTRLPLVQAEIQRLQGKPRAADAEKRPQPIDKRPRLAELKTKVTRGAREDYTPQEQFYLQHGWKNYLRTYGVFLSLNVRAKSSSASGPFCP